MDGKYFEDLEINQTFVTRGRTLTETDIAYYAGFSWDYNPEHTDAEFARASIFKERIAHMLLSLVFANGLSAATGFLRGTARGYLGLNWRTLGICKVGDTLHVKETILEKKDSPRVDVGIVVIGIEVINQRGEVVNRGERTMLVAHKPKPGVAERPWEFVFTLEALENAE
ncbi:MAG TPA: MaoC/PaaZ C-terminal domain-containing protein [Blastocatellia bacterium]|nr:MaoC/PaaZ C-terminal domain-containing protein [Blastocatellia bacterium]